MNSIRKWLYKPKRNDKSLLAQFYFADDELNTVASELDSFDSRKDPERCQALVAQLRTCQDRVLTIIQSMMTEAIPFSRSSRDFRVKFPDDVVQENLAGQLWFGAECLAAGSSIMNREVESASMRPLARALTKNLDSLRHILRDQCLININEYSERIREALTIFDKLFAEFELSYVSAMVPVKSVKEYETIQEITVLFSETVIRAKARSYVTTDMIDEYDPALMFTIPRLAIICGLLVFGDGPLNPDHQSLNMSDMFRPFQTLLYKIRELLYTLSEAELLTLERALCSQEEPDFLSSAVCAQALAMSNGCVSTSTIAVQTDSPVLGRKGTTDSEASCSSLDQLDPKGSSDDLSLAEGEQQGQPGVDRGRSVEHISCQWGRLSETPPSDAAFCELEEGAAGQTVAQDCSRQTKNLNKSDSNDSGLHSDVVSACDSQFTVSPSGSSQLISQAGCASPQQDLLVEEVIELCLEHSDTETLTTQEPRPSSLPGLTPACEVTCAVERDTGPQNDGCDETLISGEDQSYASPLCEDFEDDRLSGEEDSFYTPSSGVSPLHQPSGDGEARPESHQTEPRGLGMVTHDSLQSVSSVEDTDENKENIEGHVAGSSLLEHRISEDSSENMYSILQRVQQSFISQSRSSLEEETGGGDNVSDVNNSSLTDSTLTNLTPPDCNSPPKLSTEEPQLHWCSCADGGNRTLGTACPAECERCLLQIPCGPLQSEMVVSESELASEAGAAAASLDGYCEAVDLGEDCGTDSSAETSQNQCDRCTQTPHSAINNDQSSKIYHHHHHHHCHNAPSHSMSGHQVGSASSSVPVHHHTPPSCDSKQRNSSRRDGGKRNSSDAAQQSSSKEKSGVEESPRSAGKRARGSKSRKSSLRTRKQKASQQSEAERLRQYENNWSNCSNSTSSDSERKGRRRADRSSIKALAETSSGSSCEEYTSTSDCESEESCGSSETSSYNSESHDDEEIALAVQAAELANRNQARARFRSSSDMIHRLFVCISGVADQLQTNFAGDLRNILRVVFNLNCSESVIIEDEKTFRHHRRRAARLFPPNFGGSPQSRGSRDPPVWLPDEQSTMCMSCKTPFTFVRRRHHCRNCGKIFCGRCSSNAVSLPHFGHSKAVRVCNHCFVFQVNPFSMQSHI